MAEIDSVVLVVDSCKVDFDYWNIEMDNIEVVEWWINVEFLTVVVEIVEVIVIETVDP